MRRFLPRPPLLVAVVAVSLVVVGFLAARSETGQALLGRWSFVKSVTDDRGTYYRLKVKLAYKGEPQDFDIVVGCNVRQIIYKDNSRTYEAGLIPTVFGRRMSDGKGLVVRPPNACQGQTTANGKVQPDLLPVVVVYENAETLDFGIAYLSEDAYESPLSVLKFGGATIEKATRPEFDEFRRTQKNLITRSTYWTGAAGADVLKQMGIRPASKPFARMCEGYERYRLSGELRSLLRQYWPEEHPTYWVTTFDAERVIHQSIFNNRTILTSDGEDDPGHRPWTFGDSAANLGMPTRGGGGLVSTVRGSQFAPAYYPAASDYRLDKWPSNNEGWLTYVASADKIADMHVDFRGGQTKGFAYCSVRAFPDEALNAALSGKRVAALIDGKNVMAVGAGGRPSFLPRWILERDEYALHFFYLSLGSTRGDV
jgi:hypothetical protein